VKTLYFTFKYTTGGSQCDARHVCPGFRARKHQLNKAQVCECQQWSGEKNEKVAGDFF